MAGNAEKVSLYVLVKKFFLIIFLGFFPVFIQISFPGLIGRVIFVKKGFHKEEWILTTTLHYSGGR